MIDDLSKLSAADIDALPFGYIALAPDGTIRKYNRYEADLARKDPEAVLGKNFFREVAPCTQVRDFEGRFHDFVSGEARRQTLTFDFEFGFRHGSQKVRIGLVRSPLEKEVIVTVNRIRDLRLPLEAAVRHEPELGRLVDANAKPVVTANADFWRALDGLYENHPADERRQVLHRLGKDWGWRHALRVEDHVQRQHSVTLREVELQVALESLSGSLGVLGLGRFDVDLRYRNRGLLVVAHHNSPFTALLVQRDGHRCDVLAGVFAGFLSYISGRSLAGREIDCSVSTAEACRFLVGTERRLERLFDPVRGSADANLLLALGVTFTARESEDG